MSVLLGNYGGTTKQGGTALTFAFSHSDFPKSLLLCAAVGGLMPGAVPQYNGQNFTLLDAYTPSQADVKYYGLLNAPAGSHNFTWAAVTNGFYQFVLVSLGRVKQVGNFGNISHAYDYTPVNLVMSGLNVNSITIVTAAQQRNTNADAQASNLDGVLRNVRMDDGSSYLDMYCGYKLNVTGFTSVISSAFGTPQVTGSGIEIEPSKKVLRGIMY